MHVGIIGAGNVGLVTGACFAEFGLFVTCADKDEARIESLMKGIVPFYEPGLEAIVQRNLREGRLNFSTKVADAVKESLVTFITVGTPPQGDGSPDLRDIEAVAAEMADHMDGYRVIVTKSTVPIGTGEKIRQIMSRRLEGRADFDLVSNPEFLREGSAVEDFMHPDRVVIGAGSPQAVSILRDLYRPLYLMETPFVITTVETAEIIKYASNAFLATKISFINEMAWLCEELGGDVRVVAEGMGLDRRIGPKFLHAGPGFGGSCLPKDTRALRRIEQEHGVEGGIVEAAVRINERQRRSVIEKMRKALSGFEGKTLALLGLSYKPDTDDIREAPSIDIIEAVQEGGGKVKAYDPAAMEAMRSLYPDVSYCAGAYQAAEAADALVIVTEWNQFRNLELERIKSLLMRPCFFDLRNIYEPEKMKQMGFEYFSVGRA